MSELEAKDIVRLYRSLNLIRRTEEEIARIYPSDKIKSPVHLSIGQEFVAVGVCDVLRPNDYASGTYRSHATYLAKGGDLKAMMAELFGKSTGITCGKGGSMHLIDMEHGVLGTSAVVGTTIPMALGFALACKRQENGQIVVCFFGDGATEEGAFSESLNFAALHKLPILFVCENNGYAIHSPLSSRWATERLLERVETYGIPTSLNEDGDVIAIRRQAAAFVDLIRGGSGPMFMECKTYRWHEHVGPDLDFHIGYRSEDEVKAWKKRDSVIVIGEMLDAAEKALIDIDIEEEIAKAISFAEESPFPGEDQLNDFVLASHLGRD